MTPIPHTTVNTFRECISRLSRSALPNAIRNSLKTLFIDSALKYSRENLRGQIILSCFTIREVVELQVLCKTVYHGLFTWSTTFTAISGQSSSLARYDLLLDN